MPIPFLPFLIPLIGAALGAGGGAAHAAVKGNNLGRGASIGAGIGGAAAGLAAPFVAAPAAAGAAAGAVPAEAAATAISMPSAADAGLLTALEAEIASTPFNAATLGGSSYNPMLAAQQGFQQAAPEMLASAAQQTADISMANLPTSSVFGDAGQALSTASDVMGEVDRARQSPPGVIPQRPAFEAATENEVSDRAREDMNNAFKASSSFKATFPQILEPVLSRLSGGLGGLGRTRRVLKV